MDIGVIMPAAGFGLRQPAAAVREVACCHGGGSGVIMPCRANAVRLAAGCMAESDSRLSQSKAYGDFCNTG